MPCAAPFVRSPYNYDVTAASDDAAYVETMPSLTVQSMSQDADINIMMKRFGIGAPMPVDARQPMYGDFTHLTDYRSALDAVTAAEASFLSFPADLRAQFQNNPQLFLDFVENPANVETVKQWFPKENLNGVREESIVRSSAGREAASQSGSSSEAGGVGAPPGNGGASVSK